MNKCTDSRLKAEIDSIVTTYYNGDYSKLISYKGLVASVEGWRKGGAIQYEFNLTIEQLKEFR